MQTKQIKKLLSINHCQDKMMENLRTRLEVQQLVGANERPPSELTRWQMKALKSRKSRSSSIKFRKEFRRSINKKFETDDTIGTHESRRKANELTASASLAEEMDADPRSAASVERSHDEHIQIQYEQADRVLTCDPDQNTTQKFNPIAVTE